MIIPSWLPFAVALVITIFAMYLLSKKVKLNNPITIFFLLGLGILLIGILMTSFLTTFAIIETSDTGYSHKRVHFVGTPAIKLSNGSVIETKELEFTEREKYILNNTTDIMVMYPTVYGPSGYTDKMTLPDHIYLPAGTLKCVESFPDYWFVDAPQSIKVEEHILDKLFKSDKDRCVVKWILRSIRDFNI